MCAPGSRADMVRLARRGRWHRRRTGERSSDRVPEPPPRRPQGRRGGGDRSRCDKAELAWQCRGRDGAVRFLRALSCAPHLLRIAHAQAVRRPAALPSRRRRDRGPRRPPRWPDLVAPRRRRLVAAQGRGQRPGGVLLEAARREFDEETGHRPPDGHVDRPGRGPHAVRQGGPRLGRRGRPGPGTDPEHDGGGRVAAQVRPPDHRPGDRPRRCGPTPPRPAAASTPPSRRSWTGCCRRSRGRRS